MESSAAIEIAKHTLLSGGLILAIGTVTGLLAQKIKIPDVALFLIVGMAIGPEVRADQHQGRFGAQPDHPSVRRQLHSFRRRRLAAFQRLEAGLDHDCRARDGRRPDHRGRHRPCRLLRARRSLIVALLLGATLASTDPATLVPIFRQVKIRDRVAQTVMSESAFNDAMGAIVTFGVLGVAMGTGEFSLTASLFDLIKQSIIGIIAGAALGYLAALLIAHERWSFLSEYAPVVTLVAVIGAYFAADGLQASGFMAVFVFGIMIGNKDAFGFKMAPAEAQKLDEFVMTTAFIMRLFIFILLGAQVDFHLMGQYWFGGVIVVAIFMLVARPVTVFLCAAGSAREVELQRDAVHVLDARDRRHSGRARRPVARHEGARRANDRVGHLHRHSDDDLDPSADHKVARKELGTVRGKVRGLRTTGR